MADKVFTFGAMSPVVCVDVGVETVETRKSAAPEELLQLEKVWKGVFLRVGNVVVNVCILLSAWSERTPRQANFEEY